MFRSARRAVVFPQAEHARLAAAIAAVWGNDEFPPPPVPFDSFVRGVALHDRGYGELDDDDLLGDIPVDRWLEIQRRGFQPSGGDPVVDLVVALHVRRLVGDSGDPDRAALAQEFDAALPDLRAAAGAAAAEAAAADAITAFCDRIAFDFCVEEPAAGSVSVAGREIAYAIDGGGSMTLSPWPLGVARHAGVVTAFQAEGYPRKLDPVIVVFRVQPPST